MSSPTQSSELPLSEFNRALRAIVKVPKSAVLKAERAEKRKPQASQRKAK